MKKIREAIALRRFADFRAEFYRSYAKKNGPEEE